jgi:hypothetical protein
MLEHKVKRQAGEGCIALQRMSIAVAAQLSIKVLIAQGQSG